MGKSALAKLQGEKRKKPILGYPVNSSKQQTVVFVYSYPAWCFQDVGKSLRHIPLKQTISEHSPVQIIEMGRITIIVDLQYMFVQAFDGEGSYYHSLDDNHSDPHESTIYMS